jgi:hypothetical protein
VTALFPPLGAPEAPTFDRPYVKGEFPDPDHRDWLTCWWDASLPLLPWLMLNPSAAGGQNNPRPRFKPAPDNLDPTLRRCRSFSAAAGYGGFYVANLYTVIDPSPSVLASERPDVLGSDEGPLHRIAALDRVVCAWGAEPRGVARAAVVLRDILVPARIPLLALSTTRGGHPGHPLYLRSDLRPSPWSP